MEVRFLYCFCVLVAMKSTIRYVNKTSIPKEKHYIVSRFPLGSSVEREVPIKYQTVVRIDGHIYDAQLGRWKREQRFVTVSHSERMKRNDIEDLAETVCQKTSKDFRIKKTTLVDARRSPVYDSKENFS